MTDRLMCPTPLTIDYDARVLYWTDYCWYRIECMALDGGGYHVIQNADIFFSGAMTLFNNTLFWIQNVPVGIFSTAKTGGEEARMIYPGASTQPFRDIKVVHPSRQYIHPGNNYIHWWSCILLPTIENYSHSQREIAAIVTHVPYMLCLVRPFLCYYG